MARALPSGALGVLLAVASVQATMVEDLCPSNSTPPDPCLVTANVTLDDGSVIDAGLRTLVVSAGKTIQIPVDGRGTVRAAKIVLEDGARIFGPAAEVVVRATGSPGVSGDLELRGASSIDVSNSATFANDYNLGSAGSMDIIAAGDVVAHGDLLARGFGGGENFDGTGGPIFLRAGGSGSFHHIDTSGGPNGYFGLVYLDVAGPVTVDGPIDMTGGAWSGSDDLVILSGGDAVVSGTINLSVTLPEEAAGPAFIRGHNVTISGSVFARGGDDPYEGYGGYGGELDVEATGNIDILADIVLPAAAGGGGGVMSLSAGGNVHTGSLDLDGPGRYGSGGALEIDAGGTVTLGSVDLSGGYSGGSFEVRASGPVTLATVNAVATDSVLDDPYGGFIQVVSGNTVTVAGTVKARDVASFGGEVSLEGCAVNVQAGADIATVVTRLTSHEQMTVAGRIASDAATTLRYRAGGPLPIVVGSVTPAPSLVAAALTACAAPSVCGNGTVEPPEECDHGAANGTSGSSCRAVCKERPPGLRIPGGGSRTLDCAAEWAAALAPGQLAIDGSGLPRNFQACTDNDPACDADPTADTCTFHVWVCLGGADARLACPAAGVSSVEVRGPTGARGAPGRVVLVGALQTLSFPVGPGEKCSGRADVDVPVGKSAKLRTRAQLASGKRDSDGLTLKCRAP